MYGELATAGSQSCAESPAPRLLCRPLSDQPDWRSSVSSRWLSHEAPPSSGSWWARKICRARYQPSALPTKTSEGKCCLPVTLVKVTVEAKVYAKIFVRGPGYSCATTLATDQAIVLCSDGNELPPRQKDPFPLP